MGRLMAGAMILLFVLIANTVAAFIGTDSATGSDDYGQCSTSNNVTTCESVGKADFFSAIVGTTFTGFDGAPAIINALWGILMGVLLTVAILLIVLAFIPLTAE